MLFFTGWNSPGLCVVDFWKVNFQTNSCVQNCLMWLYRVWMILCGYTGCEFSYMVIQGVNCLMWLYRCELSYVVIQGVNYLMWLHRVWIILCGYTECELSCGYTGCELSYVVIQGVNNLMWLYRVWIILCGYTGCELHARKLSIQDKTKNLKSSKIFNFFLNINSSINQRTHCRFASKNINIYNKIAPTCFGLTTILKELIIRA
jgi:hypothetical protein